jgi:hypothetical protein
VEIILNNRDMEVKDLRIGNWIEQGVVHSVGHSSGHSGYLGVYVLKDQYSSGPSSFVRYADLRPIPLTEEWLLRFGFVKQQDHIWTFPTNSSLRLWGFSWNVQQWSYNRMGDGWDDIISPNIEYVHQLQNLYFALIGEELKTK